MTLPVPLLLGAEHPLIHLPVLALPDQVRRGLVLVHGADLVGLGAEFLLEHLKILFRRLPLIGKKGTLSSGVDVVGCHAVTVDFGVDVGSRVWGLRTGAGSPILVLRLVVGLCVVYDALFEAILYLNIQ